MNPLKRLRALCFTASIAHCCAVILIVRTNPAPEVWTPVLLVLMFSLAGLIGVFALSRPARLFFPMSLVCQVCLAGAGYLRQEPVSTLLSLFGSIISILILVLVFTAPAKRLFRSIDPDAPVQ